jgi:alkaline phosphatase D
VPLRWEVAEDRTFGKLVAGGSEFPSHQWAHSVHAEVRGLEPGRWYFYRFLASDAVSSQARLHRPAAASIPTRLRFAFAPPALRARLFGAYAIWLPTSPT